MPPHVLIIAALLTFASGISAQEPAAGLLDGTLIERIRESLDAHREALDRQQAESRALRELWERIDLVERDGKPHSRIADWLDSWGSDGPGPVSRFLDRIGNGLLLLCGTVALGFVCLAPFGVAMLVREVRRKA